MRCPVYISWFEPRVRRRWWSDSRRAKAIAKEALTGGPMPARFYVSLPQSHANNPNKPNCFMYYVEHLCGEITTMITTSSFD